MAIKTQTKKQEIIEMIQHMPDDLDEDDVMYALYVKTALDRGLADENAGRLVSNEEARKPINEWLQSTGQ